jgi:hypothetical protein
LAFDGSKVGAARRVRIEKPVVVTLRVEMARDPISRPGRVSSLLAVGTPSRTTRTDKEREEP